MKEIILPLIDNHHSPEEFAFKEGTIIDYNLGGDSYIKAIVVKVHWDDGTKPYHLILFDNGRWRQTEAVYMICVELDGNSSANQSENCQNI